MALLTTEAEKPLLLKHSAPRPRCRFRVGCKVVKGSGFRVYGGFTPRASSNVASAAVEDGVGVYPSQRNSIIKR